MRLPTCQDGFQNHDKVYYPLTSYCTLIFPSTQPPYDTRGLCEGARIWFTWKMV